MHLLLLRAYGGGYRGCAFDDHDYFFFQCRRTGEVKRLKSYPRKDFIDQQHFVLMMRKFVSPPTFLQPPVPILELTLGALNQANAHIQSSSATGRQPS